MISVRELLAGAVLMGLSACGLGDSPDACDHTLGQVIVDLSTGEGPYNYGSPVVTVTYPGDVDIDYTVDESGHLEFEVESGTYIIEAGDETGGCFTDEPTTLDVEPCGVHEVELVMSVCWG
jgi:hypothetical protein